MGNVSEWNETLNRGERGYRGSEYGAASIWMSSYGSWHNQPVEEYGNMGFRVASVPEPCSLVLLSLGGLLLRRKYRR